MIIIILLLLSLLLKAQVVKSTLLKYRFCDKIDASRKVAVAVDTSPKKFHRLNRPERYDCAVYFRTFLIYTGRFELFFCCFRFVTVCYFMEMFCNFRFCVGGSTFSPTIPCRNRTLNSNLVI